MLVVGYFEGLDSERGIAWRCADSLSLRQFLKLGASEAVPDHSTLSRTRARLPLEVHDAVFALVLRLVARHGLVKGRRVGVEASTIEANAAMRSIVRREDGAGWPAMLGELARTSGIATPTTDRLRQFDRTRAGKRVSNADWISPVDPEARITRLKDGRTRLAYKPEHAVDLDSGAILAAAVHPGDAGDTQTLEATLEVAATNLEALDAGAGARRRGRGGCRQRLPRPGGAEAPRRRAPGRRGSPSRRAGPCCAGTATTTPGVRSTPTAPGCSRAWPGSRSCCGRCCASGRSPTCSTGVACGGPGARARQRRQALPDPRRRLTTSGS